MLEINNLTKSFNNIYILDHISLKLQSGKILGLIGPDGSGKTTIMRILSGIIPADSGEAIYEYIDLLKDAELTRKCIGFIPDFFGVYRNLKVKEYMEFYTEAFGMYGLKGRSRASELLKLASLSEVQNAFVTDLSKGMQKRLDMARALIQNPAFLLMDEPFSGLDFKSRELLQKLLRNLSENGIGILMTSHTLTELSDICTDIGMIEGGQLLIQGSMSDVFNRINVSNPLCLIIYKGKEAAIQVLREDPLVTSFSIDKNRLRIRFTGNEEERSILLSKMINNHVLVQEFYREQGNLESLLLKLTDEKKAGD